MSNDELHVVQFSGTAVWSNFPELQRCGSIFWNCGSILWKANSEENKIM